MKKLQTAYMPLLGAASIRSDGVLEVHLAYYSRRARMCLKCKLIVFEPVEFSQKTPSKGIGCGIAFGKAEAVAFADADGLLQRSPRKKEDTA